ncbi:ABC transporter substrate-binding protein [Variovorax sp. PBL-E5]|uniref:ABC transporter substrate-binding protein n=1 Tax=Variovorax sp. PBL-E5 TaxID=434014 RepID=UPI001315C2D7|nr:extracellular solute-binding protein [Variovorax sp. PBL-E5]VTU35828.1 Major ferric iron-binding protein [Variovorax sp. PBL-E5]
MTSKLQVSSPVHRRTFLQIGAAMAGAGALWRAPRALAASDPKIVEAAKKEGTVSLYSSASTGPSNAIAEAFRKKYGINVSVYRAGSADVATRVQTEESAGRTQADALIIEEPALSLMLPYLADYDSPERAAIDAAYKAPSYTLIRMYMAQLGWNTGTVKAADAPRDWKDLLDPKWKGRFGSLDPHVTATTLAWLVMVDKLYGPSYLQGFGANQPKLYASTNAMSQAIVSGEIDMGLTNSFGVIQMADTGAPIAGVVPKNTVLFGGNISVFAKAPHPNAARLFCDFACSAEGQSLINVAGATIPTHPDARAPKAGSLAELGKTHTFSQPDYKKIIADTPKLLAEWDKYVK